MARDHHYRTQEYVDHLKSPEWKKTRQLRIESVARAFGYLGCEWCRKPLDQSEAELHHLHYDTLGDEVDEDVALVCPDCHKRGDKIRKEEAERKRAEERAERAWEARLDGWARKRYGEDWQYYEDEWVVEEAFIEWLERRGEY